MIIQRGVPTRRHRNPYSDLEGMREELNRLLDHMGNSNTDVSAGVYPPINIWQNDRSYTLLVELPGVSGKDIVLSVLKNTLTLSGKRTDTEPVEDISYHRKERQHDQFKRSIELPIKIDPDNIIAEFSEGILKVVINKIEEEQPRNISVNTI